MVLCGFARGYGSHGFHGYGTVLMGVLHTVFGFLSAKYGFRCSQGFRGSQDGGTVFKVLRLVWFYGFQCSQDGMVLRFSRISGWYGSTVFKVLRMVWFSGFKEGLVFIVLKVFNKKHTSYKKTSNKT